MSESVGSAEFLLGIEEYLRYLNQNNYAESIHTLARTISSEEKLVSSVKAFMQDLGGKIRDTNINVADFLHGIVKSETIIDSNKNLLQYIGKITVDNQDTKDLIFSIIKSSNNETTYKSLLQYIGKTVDNQDTKDLIFSIIKSSNNETTYKSLLQYIGKTVANDQDTKDLIFSIIKSADPTLAYKHLLHYFNKTSQEKTLQDLIHGSIKSDNLLNVYKSSLQYVGKSLTENKILADLSLAIQRSIDSDNFENEFIKSQLSTLDRQFLNDKIFRGINNFIKLNFDRSIINDAFSRSQIRSKIWLINELRKIKSNFDNVIVFAGWLGQIKSIYDKQLTYSKMRIVELDKQSCEISDYIFNLSNLEDYKVKSVHSDINNLTLHKNGYEWEVENFKDGTKYSEKFLPNLIINTSAEHMTEEWFHQIRFKELEGHPIVAIQSNNLFDIPEHVNCVHSIEHMKKKFPMRKILFEGELQLKGYKRVMLIGRP